MTQHTAESRTVTRAFLIADIRGYTAFTRTHGDEAAGQLAGTFAALARLAVTARCGKVLELRGDEVLAVFEDAAQAARAAVELQAICSEDADKSPAGFGFPVGIGLDHGEVVPIEDGYRGAAINLAARLCSKAAAGEVLATQKLLDLTGEIDIAHCEEREPVEVKGYAEPVAIAALSLRPTGTPTTSSRGPLPAELDSFVPHVGRDDELNWLVGTWRQARRGRGRIVVISGEGGIGKTRIAAEAASRADAATVAYAGGGGAGAAVMSAAIHTACHADVPTLAILDDLQHYPDAVDSLLTLADAIESRPTLIVALVRDAGSSREISELTSRINTRGDGWRDLEPLDVEMARAIVALYAGDELADAPIESMTRASGGNPGRLHEVASDWARDEARRRLSAAAEWIAESRAKQSSGLTFANNVIALRLGRMFAERSDLASDLCPYKGLAPFEPTDAAYFYGREKLVGDLAARSVGAGMLAVVGPSGSGKSSVVMAGLLPSLAGGLLPGSDRWVQQVIRPGSQPMKALSAVLPQQRNDRLVLVVDQFEETFTSCENVAEQADFIARLVDLAHDPDRHIVVVTIRADFTGHCTPWPELSQLIADNLVLVGPMTDDELHRAIELPARRVGLRVESSLADALVSEVSDEPGGLPLLSTALVELWQGRDDGWLRYRTYEATGGVRAAVARLAEASYSQLSAHGQEIARSLLLRLVGEGEGDAAVRRRAPLNEFDDEPAVVAILTRLTEDRLLTRDDDHIEIAHEALIREWPRFRGWLDEDATGRQLRQHITQAAKTWSERGEDDADLYRGARLSATLDWSAAHLRDLNQLERSFLERSRQASVRDADKQRRTNRRLRGLLAGTALFLVVALIAGILAVVQRGHARTAQTAAEAQALTSDSERLGALALAEKNIDKSLLLAVAGWKLQDRHQTRSDLFSVLERNPALIHITYPSPGSVDAVSVTPDGRIIATGSSSGEIVFYNSQSWTTSGKPVQTGMGVIHQAMTFTPNGRYLVVAAHSDTSASVLLIDAKTHRVVRKLAWTKSIPPYLAVSPDGRQLAVLLPTYSNNTLAAVRTRIDLYALPTLRRQGVLRYPNGTGGDLEQVAYVGNNRLVASDMDPIKNLGGAVVPAPTTMLFDARTGRLLRTFPNGGVIAAAPDDRTVAIGTDDDEAGSSGRVLLLDVRTGHERALTSASGLGSAYSLAFSPDGKTLLSGDDQSTLRRWDTATGTLTGTFTGDGGLVDDIRFAPDGATAYTGGSDGGVLAWDLGGRQQLGQTLTWGTANDACWATCFAVNPAETLMATNEFGIHRMQLIDPRSFTALRTVKLSDRSEQDGLDFSPDGQTLATTGRAGLVTFWRAPAVTPYAHLSLSGPGDFVKFAPDGKLLATESDLGLHGATVTLWTWPSLRRMRSWNITGDASGMAFSPDGSTLMTVTQVPAGGGLQLRDVATGKELRVPSTDQAITHAAFSPDDRTLAIGLYDGSLLFWDLQRHRLVGAPLRIGSVGIGSLAFSPTGRLLAVGTLDAVQTIWDVRARSQIGAPLPSPSGQTSVTQFLRNGDLIDEYNGNAIKWPTSANAWAAFACEVAGRDMTRAEWHDLLPNRPYQHVCPG